MKKIHERFANGNIDGAVGRSYALMMYWIKSSAPASVDNAHFPKFRILIRITDACFICICLGHASIAVTAAARHPHNPHDN